MRFTYRHKLASGDEVTICGESLEQWQSDVAAVRKTMGETMEPGERTYDGFLVHQKDGRLRVHFYIREAHDHKILTAYDNHFPLLGIDPNAYEAWQHEAPPTWEEAERLGFFHELPMQIETRPNPRWDPSDNFSRKTDFVKMIDPPPGTNGAPAAAAHKPASVHPANQPEPIQPQPKPGPDAIQPPQSAYDMARDSLARMQTVEQRDKLLAWCKKQVAANLLSETQAILIAQAADDQLNRSEVEIPF